MTDEEKIDVVRSDVPYCMLVPERAIGPIIGPKGANIQKIQTESGASIDVAKRHETGAVGFHEKLVVIKGDSLQKMDAVRALANVVHENAEKQDDDSQLELVILLPSASVPLVIGTRGAKIKELQDSSSAIIDVSKSGVPGRCSVKGNMEEIMNAVAAIWEVVETDKRGSNNFVPQAQLNSVGNPPYGAGYAQYGGGYGGIGKGFGKGSYGGGPYLMYGDRGRRTQVDWYMVIPSSCCSAIIGSRGCVVNDIQQRSGASVDIPKDGDVDGDKTIIIRGEENAKSYGLDLILHQLAQCREFQQGSGAHAPPIRFQIPSNCAGKLVGPGGSTVQMIAQKTNTRIDVGREPFGSEGNHRLVNVSGDVNGIVAVAMAVFDLCGN